ncbi:MAG: lamin tail domain-containing protein [Ginsengibacter sp.]
MNKKLLLFGTYVLLSSEVCQAQLTDNFNDGNFSTNPTWDANTADWTVNPALQLQSNNMAANSSFYISTVSTLATSTQWEFYTKIDFNPSSANYVDVYLIASASDISAAGTSGYFVRIGNTDDEISLYRKNTSGVITKIIDGVNGILNISARRLKIKITRSVDNKWTLFRDITGTGNNYLSEGSVIDATYTMSSFFGILIKQSTSSFFKKHFFDDIVVTTYTPDVIPPVIQSVTATSINTLDILFNESVDFTTSQTTGNYVADNGIGSPASAITDVANTALVHLTFGSNFPNNTVCAINVNGVTDLSGNAISNGNATFVFYIPAQFDIVIDEIFANPTPQVGLPISEFIELKNVSEFPINLTGWKLSDGTSIASLPSFILQPDSFIIICGTSAASAYIPFGTAFGVSNFPSLNDENDVIFLRSSQNAVIHAVSYSSLWYQNELKKEGGWTLEMIDTKNPCSGFSNWKASVDLKGGTPGKRNSIDAVNADEASPKLLRAFATDSVTLSLVFDEPLDSLKASTAANYKISDTIGKPLVAIPVSPVFDKVILILARPLLRNKIYSVTTSAVTDCAGNEIGSQNITRAGLTLVADSFDIVINEILFNPSPDGVDYVEIYNRSTNIIDLKQLYIANRNSTGVISSIRQLSAESILIFPGDFIVITEDPSVVQQKYLTTNPNAFIQVSGMPSFSDDKGNVIILNIQGKVIDEVVYSDKWHFQLLSNTEGISLERINYNAPSLQPNFHSAATSVGYGTPGYKNSQLRMDEQLQGEVTVTPEIFSPDNDGTDDFGNINYNFPEPGYIANITIFDASGRPVRYLQRNALSGIKGSYRWDGLGEKQQKLSQGIYIVFTEIFNTAGKKKQFKNTIVLARR